MGYRPQKAWAVVLLTTFATTLTQKSLTLLPRTVLQARNGLRGEMNIGQLIYTIIGFFKDANAYVSVRCCSEQKALLKRG